MHFVDIKGCYIKRLLMNELADLGKANFRWFQFVTFKMREYRRTPAMFRLSFSL
jgi:hypothetical protein